MRFKIDPYIWQKRFAWLPWKTINGQWVWLEWVEVTGYVENKEIYYGMEWNCRLFSPSFCVRRLDKSAASD